LQTFVLDTLPRLNVLVGEGWASGQIEVFEEHLYTEQIQVLLRQSIAALPPGTRRRCRFPQLSRRASCCPWSISCTRGIGAPGLHRLRPAYPVQQQ
jgi:hypothetical protein